MRRMLPAGVLMAVAFVLGGCGSSGPVPQDAVQSYLSDLAEGNYPAACGMLAGGTRAALVASFGGRDGCQEIYRHCLPSDPAALKRDQTQLLFDAVQAYINGRHARALLTGPAVAHEINRVTLMRKGYRWFLTRPGKALQHCLRGGRNGGRRSRRQRS